MDPTKVYTSNYSSARFTLYSDENINWKIIDQREDIFTLDSCIKAFFTLGLRLRQHHRETSSLTLCQWRQKHKYTKWSEPILDVFH